MKQLPFPPSTKVIADEHSAVDENPGSKCFNAFECNELISIAG